MGLPSRREITEHYAARTGLDVSSAGWYEAFAQWKTGVVVQQLHNRWLRGESTDPRMATIADCRPSRPPPRPARPPHLTLSTAARRMTALQVRTRRRGVAGVDAGGERPLAVGLADHDDRVEELDALAGAW